MHYATTTRTAFNGHPDWTECVEERPEFDDLEPVIRWTHKSGGYSVVVSPSDKYLNLVVGDKRALSLGGEASEDEVRECIEAVVEHASNPSRVHTAVHDAVSHAVQALAYESWNRKRGPFKTWKKSRTKAIGEFAWHLAQCVAHAEAAGITFCGGALVNAPMDTLGGDTRWDGAIGAYLVGVAPTVATKQIHTAQAFGEAFGLVMASALQGRVLNLPLPGAPQEKPKPVPPTLFDVASKAPSRPANRNRALEGATDSPADDLPPKEATEQVGHPVLNMLRLVFGEVLHLPEMGTGWWHVRDGGRVFACKPRYEGDPDPLHLNAPWVAYVIMFQHWDKLRADADGQPSFEATLMGVKHAITKVRSTGRIIEFVGAVDVIQGVEHLAREFKEAAHG